MFVTLQPICKKDVIRRVLLLFLNASQLLFVM